MEIIEVLKTSKKNLEAQYKELTATQVDISQKLLMVKGALMWVNQTLTQIKTDSPSK